jgi:hypothetical protein
MGQGREGRVVCAAAGLPEGHFGIDSPAPAEQVGNWTA